MKKAFNFAVCIIASFFIGFFYNENTKEDNNLIPTFNEIQVTESNSLKDSIDKIYNAVVVIETYDKNGNIIGTGSGFFYKKNDLGYIITNNHVIEKSETVKIINMNKESFSAKIIGTDEYFDLAILSVDKEAVLQVATLGTNSELNVGDTVFTVGSPLGSKYMGTVTKGILSGKDRIVSVSTSRGEYMMEVLQTDAAINPGNSGGPLVNLSGEVIGVNSLKLVQDEIEGMGFAIPISLVNTILDRLEKGEVITRPIIGLEISDLNNELLTRYKVNSGIYVNKVESDYPAKYLRVGDIITLIDDKEVENTSHFRYILYKHKVGDTIKLTYIRDGKTSSISILLDKGI